MSQMALVSSGVQLVTPTGNIAAFKPRFFAFQMQFTDQHGRVARHHFTTGWLTSFHRTSRCFSAPLCPFLGALQVSFWLGPISLASRRIIDRFFIGQHHQSIIEILPIACLLLNPLGFFRVTLRREPTIKFLLGLFGISYWVFNFFSFH